MSGLADRLLLRQLFKRLGPGIVTGAADDDPSGIATHSQAGAQFGVGLMWTVVLILPLVVAVQSVSARIGRVTGHGLAANMSRVFPKPVVGILVALLFVANTVNIGSQSAIVRSVGQIKSLDDIRATMLTATAARGGPAGRVQRDSTASSPRSSRPPPR